MTHRHCSTLLFSALLAGGCQQTDQPMPAGGAAAPVVAAVAGPVQEFIDYHLTETAKGVRQWALGSERMMKFAGREEVELVDVKMDFYRAGEHFSVLVADSGQVNPRTRAVHVWGKVDITTDDGRRLQTEDLTFDNQSGHITNEVFNRFTRGPDVLTGIGLDATPDLEYVEIKREVAAEVVDAAAPEEQQP